MMAAAGFFPWSFGGSDAKTPATARQDAGPTAQERDKGGNESPNAFELIELHRSWFGNDGKEAELTPSSGGSPASAVEQHEPAREQGSVVYRIIKSDHKTAQESEAAQQAHATTQAARRETIAETLARAEKVLQQLPELPRHSRLEASLSALEAALAGTTLSDLEAALAGTGIQIKQEAV
jgi:hypothetical protein